jgi:hypothetical protein
VFVSTTANADWTTLPAKPVYVTLVHELLSGSVRTGDDWMNRKVGEQVEIPGWIKTTQRPMLSDAARREVPIEQSNSAGGQSVWRSAPILRPGVYTLATGERTYPIAVNVPAEEADIRTLDPAAVKAALGDINMDVFSDQPAAEASHSDPGRDFGWSLMVMVLGLVAAECFMAMRFGHYRRVSVKRN